MAAQLTWLCMLLLLATAHARECVFTDPDGASFYSDDSASWVLDGCTTIVADIIDISRLDDRFYYPDVVNITGTLHVSRYTTPRGYPAVPIIDMPNLHSIGALELF
ncbi:hypothetical protein BJY04DRAFT_219105 [Aspergillus karnatakaensis]|uniref:uncharacterized protein n=1 Tax=Aspergillus karnatakaensis TaxID=1810916 RepID=UPI003CCDB0DA